MKVETSRGVLTDTGFWIALFDKSEIHRHSEAIKIKDHIEQGQILFPWPIFYEVLRTKFIKNRIWVDKFSKVMRSLSVHRIDDIDYREKALEETLEWAQNGKRPISLVDMVVRHILSDPGIRVTNLITFNEKDFSDICKRRKIPINL